MEISFLCGCTRKVESKFEEWEKVMGMDNYGFLICHEHKQRRYGWRTLPHRLFRVIPFDEEKPEYIERPDYSFCFRERDAEDAIIAVQSFVLPVHQIAA